ncbi:PR-1-like protein [Myriangium duriaei CBS 260.36]|uniref:PR-1-like protein n=1 Tax=Myriangium duriaei CBS 260.36 TaxID=1168546 RepID=A0A9P4MLV6_9PEZI|nr:PR-1-like protein [Myriangium duriaei CBS 260.36]
MRTSIMLASALAATALAKPFEKRQVVVTTVDVVYTTDVVTVTAGQSATDTVKPSASATSVPRKHHHRPSKQPSSSAVVTTTTQAPAPVYTTTEAPAPVETTTQAPAPSSYSAPAQSSSAAPAPQPSSTGVFTDYSLAAVAHHNYHRANHSAPDIAWSQSLADTAMKIAKTCVYQHSMDVDGGNYGQNIAAGVDAGHIGETISDLFYNGEVTKFTQYGVASPDMGSFEGWGHFSQIVWKASTQVGCATYDCGSSLQNFQANNGFFTVCNYRTAGNFGGEYAENIGSSLNKATVPGKYNVDTDAINTNYCKSTGQTPRSS